MAVDKFVDSSQLNSDLTSVANAIRTKGGTSSQLAFPSGFITALDNISGGWVKTLSAVFTQSTTRVFTTDDLDDLRDRLTVTATYEDNTSETVTDYELSGTLTAGTSTIVVTYGDKSTTFTATVTAAVDITPSISGWTGNSGTTVTANTTEKTLLVYNASNGTYKAAQTALFNWDEGYGYKLSFHLEYFSGTIRAGFRNSSNTLIYTISTNGSGYYHSEDAILSESPNYTAQGRISLFVTFGTSEQGRAVFSEIKLIKFSTVTPNEALNLLMGGESA